MTKKESAQALALYEQLDNILCFHNKNLTKRQEWTLQDVRDYLREISAKAYNQEKKR